jgi:hypothetical protein
LAVEYNPYERSPDRSLRSTVRQPLRDVGRTQASTVMPAVSRSAGVSAIVTHDDVPLNDSAAPVRPAVDQVVFNAAP